jgi:hypothetical protein
VFERSQPTSQLARSGQAGRSESASARGGPVDRDTRARQCELNRSLQRFAHGTRRRAEADQRTEPRSTGQANG